MGTISYYLATSLDGYLARENGAVDWLDNFQFKLNTPFDYEPFYKSVKVVLMGRKTWEVARSFEEKPYSDRKTFVISNQLQAEALPEYVSLIRKIDLDFFASLKAETNGRIWIVGGAQLASSLLELNLVDEIVQTIIPMTIGKGIRWLLPNKSETIWNLQAVFKCDRGLIQLIYTRSSA